MKYQEIGIAAAKKTEKLKAATEGFAKIALKTLFQKGLTRAQVISR